MVQISVANIVVTDCMSFLDRSGPSVLASTIGELCHVMNENVQNVDVIDPSPILVKKYVL